MMTPRTTLNAVRLRISISEWPAASSRNDYQAEHGYERTVAMSAIRKRHPGAFSRFQDF
jgi:hypothetical protein